MSEPMPRRPLPYDDADHAVAPVDATRRAARPVIDDPLEELARILGESGAYPARPETTVEVGRRATPTGRPMPQQLSALEAELFDELRASVTPETQVRGNFEREVTPPIPQRPADDHDIASLRIANPAPAAEPEPPRSAEGAQAQWSDFYAYDDGVAAGSYDPAFAQGAPAASPYAVAPAARAEAGYPQPTFDEFGREEIALAAREASPLVAAEPRIMPHSRDEERAARRLPQEGSGIGLKIAFAAIALVVVGGGAYAAWKLGGGTGSGEPVLVRADGKPLKTLPDPTKAPAADAGPSLTPDDPKAASRIVSKQEDPVDQVSGRTAEGKEVRLINPGAQRPSGDVPHTVKTVVVRPDGSIVSDGATVRPSRNAAPAPQPDAPAPQAAAPVEAPQAAPVKTVPLTPSTAAAPQASAPVPTVKTVPVTPSTTATAPTPPAAPAAVPPTPQVKTVAVTPITPPKPAPTPAPKPAATPTAAAPAGTGAPLSLGPVGPKLASTPSAAAPVAPAAAPKPAPAAPSAPVALAPAASGGGGDFLVQISASGSENEARNSFAAAQRKYSSLSGRSVDIQRADLGSKGVFYRARVPAGSREQAAALCQQLQSQGGQCMVVKR